jgi:hypothetical protein
MIQHTVNNSMQWTFLQVARLFTKFISENMNTIHLYSTLCKTFLVYKAMMYLTY